MQIFDFEQRSPEWYQIRAGIPTSSNFDKIITTEGKSSKQRQEYLYQLVGERLGGIADESYQSLAMIQGIAKEDEARMLYEIAREPIQKVGFCLSDCGRYGSSTDGLIGDKGVFELKCPLMSTHIGYMINKDEIPTDYFQQTQGEMLVTGRSFVDFMSYFPGLPPVIIREEPNETFQRLLKKELELFTEELHDLVKKLS